jgi:serine/threonine-protein kinase RsbW
MTEFSSEILAEPAMISELTEDAATFLASCGVDDRAQHHVALVLDEILTNVSMHGRGGGERVSIRLNVLPDEVVAEIVDFGNKFDPRAERNVDVGADAKDRPMGGLGLLLVHRVTDRFDYNRAGDRNRTTFAIRRTPNDGHGGTDGAA